MKNSLDYGKLITPPGDGEILVEPPVQQWPALLQHNIELQERQFFTLAGHDLRDVREATRTAMVSGDRRRAILASGHQPAFVHPGVWAKNVAVRDVASQLGVKGVDLVVDNDAPTQPDLVIPKVRDSLVTTQSIPFSSAPAGSPYEGRPIVERARLQVMHEELREAMGASFDESLLPHYLSGYEESSGANDFVDQHVTGRLSIDAPIGAYLDEYRVSRFFGGPFLADLLLNARSFAEAYNNALHIYRRREAVRSPDRPLPNLGIETDRVETALWIYRPMERRRRLWVRHESERIRLFADAQLVGEVAANDLGRDANIALAALLPWVIRPRALTLTLWSRLLVCDLFIHGIGGAKYDRITDDIFRWYYRCEPPALACVSGTLRLPLPRHADATEDLRRATRELRDVRFNPQRYVTAPSEELLLKRREWISASERLREQRADRTERRRLFLAIRELNDGLASTDPSLPGRMLQRMGQARSELESDRVARSREFFYALQPKDRLQGFAGRLLEACVL